MTAALGLTSQQSWVQQGVYRQSVGHSLNGSRRISKSAAQGCMAQDLAILREHWKTPHSFALYTSAGAESDG
jgi:hypothetical protein